MAWHLPNPPSLAELTPQDQMQWALELHKAVTELKETDQMLRGDLHIPSLGTLRYSDTGEAMDVRASMNRKLRYPWDLWANGDLWLLHRGADYHPVLQQFQTNVHVYGQNNQLVGPTRKLAEDILAVQFTPVTEGVTTNA
jgi:hypothetical protein